MPSLEANWKVLATIGAILLAGATGGAWAIDIQQQVAANTTARQLQEFERLSLIRKQRRLTHVEWLKWCEAGRYLRVFTTCPER